MEEVKVGEKIYEIKELKYKDIAGASQLKQEESAKKLVVLSTGMAEEDYDELSLREGLAIMKKVNEVNGISEEDFQKPQTK